MSEQHTHHPINRARIERIQTFTSAATYPFAGAAYEVERMLAAVGITEYRDLLTHRDMTERIMRRVCEITVESDIQHQHIGIFSFQGRFYHNATESTEAGCLDFPRLTADNYVSPLIRGFATRAALGEYRDFESDRYRVVLGLNIPSSAVVNGDETRGYWFIPFGGNDISILPPPELN